MKLKTIAQHLEDYPEKEKEEFAAIIAEDETIRDKICSSRNILRQIPDLKFNYKTKKYDST